MVQELTSKNVFVTFHFAAFIFIRPIYLDTGEGQKNPSIFELFLLFNANIRVFFVFFSFLA